MQSPKSGKNEQQQKRDTWVSTYNLVPESEFKLVSVETLPLKDTRKRAERIPFHRVFCSEQQRTFVFSFLQDDD
jgi:hypothetical protein